MDTEKTWRAIHVHYLKFFFEKLAEKWKDGGYTDDRIVYCNIYKHILDAIYSLPEEPHNFVCVAMNRYMDEDIEILKSIQERFKDRDDCFISQFVEDLFRDAETYGACTPMTVEEAAYNLEQYREEKMKVPYITPEKFAEQWNELCNRAA